jgi:hypothetical protein
MSQNGLRLQWTREEVDQRLHNIMISIHENCRKTAEEYGTPGNYVNGANIAGFLKVATSMMDQGWCNAQHATEERPHARNATGDFTESLLDNNETPHAPWI